MKNIRDLPKHAIEDLENDDPYQFGKDATNIHMFAKGELGSTTPYMQNSLEFTQPGAKLPGAWDKMLDAPAGPIAKGVGSLAMAPAMYKPEASDAEQRATLQVLGSAQRVTTTDELAKLGDLPILAIVSGNGRVLLDEEALDAGAWFLLGDETKQYTVPAYLMKADR